MATSHIRTESALDRLLQNFQNGEGSSKSKAAISAISEESMDVAWPQLLDALEECGLDRNTATENHLFIVDWLVGAMMDGLLPVDGILEHDSSSSTGSDSGPMTPVELAASDSEPDEYPVILDGCFPKLKSRNSVPTFEELKYLEPFGALGRGISKEVRASRRSTFREDVNRAREYWKRADWAEAKHHLIRALVASQRPNHRTSDLGSRCTTYLLGIAYSNSGDLETAKKIMCSVLTPFDINNQETAPCDDGQIAAATWLGDLCMKTNRIESAALAWAIAYDAANLRSIRMSQGHPRHQRSFSDSSIDSGPNSPNMTPAPLNVQARRPNSLSKSFRSTRAQTMAILNRLESVNRKTRNLDSLLESLVLGWDPDNGDSIFSEIRLLTMGQMLRVAQKARAAVDNAIELAAVNSRPPRPTTHELDPYDDSKPLPPPPPRQAIVQVPRERKSAEDILALLTPVEDWLQSPVRSSDWPLAYDVRFSRTATVKTLNWVYSYTPLDFEGVMSDLPTIDVRRYREIHPRFGRPMYIAGSLDPKKPEDGAKFLATLKRLLDTMNLEYLEEPGALRCRARTDCSSQWPSISCFSLRVIKYKTDGFMRGTKLAAYITDVLHWNGQKEELTLEHTQTKTLMREMVYTLQGFDAEERMLKPTMPQMTPSKPPSKEGINRRTLHISAPRPIIQTTW